MSGMSLNEIRSKVAALSYLLPEDSEVGYSVSYNYVTVSIEIPLTETPELPEELQLFAWVPSEVERYMDKGNSDFNSWDGTNYSIAIRNYAYSVMASLPETIALEQTLEDCNTFEDLRAYQDKRAAIWDEKVLTQPKIAAWLADLNENYE